MIQVLRPVFSKEEKQEILTEMEKILDSGWIGQGPKVKELEEEWCRLTGAKYAVATNSCTAALDIAVRAVKLPKRVSVSAFTFVSSALAPLNAGYDVELLDIEPKSLCTSKADIQVMYAGNQSGEGIIYDMAHSSGVQHKGLVSCWSFHAVKNLPAGDGGMITTNDEEVYKKARALSWCGIDKTTFDRSKKDGYAWDYNIKEPGLKAHMNDITAIIALAKLKNLGNDNAYRRWIAKMYDNLLPEFIERPFRSSTWHLYTIRVPKRDELFEFLKKNGVSCGVHYKPLTHYGFFGQDDLYECEKAYREILSLPMHLNITEDDVRRVCQLITEFYGTV